MKTRNLQPLISGVAVLLCFICVENSPGAPVVEGSPVHVKYYVMRVIANDAHPMGVTMDGGDISDALDGSDVNGLAKKLTEFGEVKLVNSGDATGIVGTKMRQYGGTEDPFITTFDASDEGTTGAGHHTRTTTQSTVESGTNVEITVDGAAPGELKVTYKFDFDSAFLSEKQERRVIGRVRLAWDSAQMIDTEGDTLVGKFAREVDGKTNDFIFVLNVETE